MSKKKGLTTAAGAPVVDNNNVITAGRRGPMLLQDVWFLEKLAHFDREVIPERRMHAKGSGAYGTFTVTHDITRYTRAKIFSEIGKQTEMFVRFSTVAGERGAADAERDIRGFAMKYYTEEGNWDLVGNDTPVFYLRDPLKFPDLNHVVKRDHAPTCVTQLISGISSHSFQNRYTSSLSISVTAACQNRIAICTDSVAIPSALSMPPMSVFGLNSISAASKALRILWMMRLKNWWVRIAKAPSEICMKPLNAVISRAGIYRFR